VLHLVDGMRLNNAFFRNAPNQYLGLVDPYATGRVEVIRGAAPSLYGADAMGGVVQILSQDPMLDGEQGRARIYASYDSVDSGLVGRAEAATGRSGNVISGGFTYQEHGNRTVGGGETVRPSAYRVRAADLKWRGDIGAYSELMLSAQALEQPSSPRVDELVPGYGQTQPSSEEYAFQPNRREFLHARYRLDGQARWFSHIEAHLARQVITDDRLTRDFGATEPTWEFNESTLDGLTLQINSPWGGGASYESESVWGFEYYRDEVASSRLRTDLSSGASREVRGRFPDQSTMDSAAVYASNRWRWERLSLQAGLRYSWFEIRLPATEEVEAVRLTPSDLTGDLHLGYQLKPGLRLLANVGRGFRPPNIFDLGTLGSRPGNRFNVPNPDLGPESVWSYDAGLKASTIHWQAEAFVWYSDYRDKISSRFTGEETPEGRLVVRSDNLSEVSLYGVEAGLRLITDAAEYYATLNYTRGEEREAGNGSVPADRVPPLNGRLGLVFRPVEELRVEPYLDFAAPQDRLSPRDREDPRIDPDGTSSWTSLSLLMAWRLSEKLELGLRLQNLFDRNYREHGSGIDAPGRNLGFWLSAELW
jgi:outer membrane receptor protein involved in Fe transport